jgi:hypothetical protein
MGVTACKLVFGKIPLKDRAVSESIAYIYMLAASFDRPYHLNLQL